MKTFRILFSLTVFTGIGFHTTAQSSPRFSENPEQDSNQKKKNIIFILSDDHRYDYMGFTGKLPWLKTPNMDKLAADGIWFKNAFVSTSLCTPSRTSILTGLYAHQHTVVDNLNREPESLIFFPEYLQEAGYQTAFLGKWHMGNDDSPRPGFNHWECLPGQGTYYKPQLNINGNITKYNDSVYITDLLTEHTLQWLKNRDTSKPFFVYLSHKAVHSDFQPAVRHRGMYRDVVVEAPPSYGTIITENKKENNWPRWVAQRSLGSGNEEFRYSQLVKSYCETLMGVDESIGAVMDYLEKEGLDENTLVIYMGDNGYTWGEHNLIDKRTFYEESSRVPLLVSYPGSGAKSKEISKMVQNIDIAPTCLEWAGLEKPENMPGQSFIQLIKGNESGWRDFIFYEYFWEYQFPVYPTVYGVRGEKYKYSRYYGINDINEFYDIENDPHELHNLIGQPEYQDLIKEYVDKLYLWLQNTDGMQIPLKVNTQRKAVPGQSQY